MSNLLTAITSRIATIRHRCIILCNPNPNPKPENDFKSRGQYYTLAGPGVGVGGQRPRTYVFYAQNAILSFARD